MEPDRFAAIALDEQRAVITINEEYLRLQGRVPRVVGERRRRRGPALALVVLVVLVAVLALAWWLLR